MEIIGIPNRSVSTNVPQAEGEMWDYVIHRHDADVAGLHYDLRISPPGSNIAYSWAIPKATLPGPYEKVLAVKQPDHSREYMAWKGEIKDGYGKGKVTIEDSGKIEVLHSSSNKITFNIYGGYESKRFNLIKTGGNNWILLNYTPTREKRNIPENKPRYKSINFNELDYRIGDEVFAPKIDGAHALFQIRKDHGIDVFSYRPSKRSGTNLIDHTFKINLNKVKPSKYNDTILRGELFGRDSEGKVIPSSRTGGMLNASVEQSRALQRQEGGLDHVVYDIVRYNGKDVENLPYKDKLDLLKEITTEIPELKLPEMAYTDEEKQKLVNKIELGENPDTDEGVVIYKMDDPVPKRSKILKDFDVYVVGIFEGTGKYKGKAAGGFTYSLEKGGPAVGRVGSGFTDEQRIDMWKNQDKYIGRVAKITTQKAFHTGSLRMPIFKEWRYEQFPKRS